MGDVERASLKEWLGRNPYCDLLKYNSVQSGQFFKTKTGDVLNPYQKPIRLYLRLLLMFVPPNAVVIDATGGSGSLELAALEPSAPANLKFITFEQNPFQFEGLLDRLRQSVQDTTGSTVDACNEELAVTNKHGHNESGPQKIFEEGGEDEESDAESESGSDSDGDSQLNPYKE